MANSARDPYWHAAVRREVLDHPAAQAAIEDKCSTCHMPMARFDSAAAGGRGEVFANLAPTAPQHALAADGVSCTVCHQIAARPARRARELRRRFRDRSARRRPRRLRAARDRRGPPIGDALGGRLHAERRHSYPAGGALRDVPHAIHDRARRRGGRDRDAAGAGAVSRVAAQRLPRDDELSELPHAGGRWRNADHAPCSAQPRPRVSQHTFLGGNAFMLGILQQAPRRARRDRVAAGARPRAARRRSATWARRPRR